MKINSQYTLHLTEDGSPTLILATGVDELLVEEKMHSRFGAAAETEYIYGPAIRWAFENCKLPKFLVVGLGLGYIEFLIAREAVSRRAFYEIHSFETDGFLRDSILSWLFNEEATELNGVLEKSLNFMAQGKDEEVKEQLRVLYENGQWRFSKDIRQYTPGVRYHCILYDLFSSKMDPEPWQLEFLNLFLSSVTEDKCAFATYAAKGALKKSLKANGFLLSDMPGFANKHESTLAFKDPVRQTQLG